MLLEIGLATGAALFVKAWCTKHRKIHGIYSQPGPFYWIKWILFYALYRWRSRQSSRHENKYDDGSDLRYLEDQGRINNQGHGTDCDEAKKRMKAMTPAIMERTQPVADSIFAIDAVYFNGFEEKRSSIKDDISVVMAFAARNRNFAEILFFVHMPELGFLQHPSHPDRIICDAGSNDYCYQGQGMTIEMLEPMRRWKLKYNGLMRLMDIEKTNGKVSRESDKLVHVKFSLIWRSYSTFVDFDTDIGAMANALASEQWSLDFFDRVGKYHHHQAHYEQWGQMKGLIQVEGNEPREVLLRGLRDHSFGNRHWRHYHRYLICIIHLKDGTSINVTSICMDATLSRLTRGYIIHPNHVQESITDVDLKLWECGEDGVIPREVKYNFLAGGNKYSVVCQVRIVPEFYNGFEWEGKVVETLADYHVNEIPGRGIAEFYYRHDGDRRSIADCQQSVAKRISVPKFNQAVLETVLILRLEDDLCQEESLTGGKASQLAVLKKWSSETDKFTVPTGFCITTNAYQQHLKENKDLQNTIQELNNISSLSDENLRELCDRIYTEFEKTSINDSFKRMIEQKYGGINGHKCPLVAVRSSAVDEDTSDLSAAGQLDTFLGISGVNKISKAVKKCWACLYSYSAVQYRRQHGQPIITSMGVVIQLLAENTKVSGVMFTQHPVTGNPAHILINSNYGLGETVVSGGAEPDTIVVACNPNNNPEIITREFGSKARKLSVNDYGDMEQSTVQAKYATELSLTELEVFELADLGKMIQSFAGAPRDIEWTISENGKISLVQSRPITCDPTETEFELMHEFDSGYSNENYIMTTANIGEMLPGPVTPLTGSVWGRTIDYGLQAFFESGSPRGLSEWNDVVGCQSHDHLLFNYTEMLRFHSTTMLGTDKESIDVNIFGRIMNEISRNEYLQYHRNDNSFLRRARNTLRFWKYLLGSKEEFKKIIAKTKNLYINGNSSEEIYQSISKYLGPYYAESVRSHLAYTALSGISTTVLMMILSKGDRDWKTEHYSDVAMIYSTCKDVISAGAPTLIKKTAKYIHESKNKDIFINSTPEEAIEWLLSKQGKAGETFRKFLKECGHRCLREAELREKSWASDPTKLGQSLQTAVRNYSDGKAKEVLNVEESIKKIKTPVTSLGRLILKWFVPLARKSIGGREWGKSNLIRITDVFKQAYWNLAGMMEKEGFLPDKDLMFYLTHGEIGRLLRTRSARLVTRFQDRRKKHQTMLLEIGLAIAAALFVKALNTKHEKIHGIYSQPGPFYWIKWIFFYVLYRWSVSRAPRHESKYDDGSDLRYLEDEGKTSNATQARKANYGAGERSKVPPAVMERTQPVAGSHFAIDAVYFNGFEEKHTSIKDDVSIVLGFTARYRNFAEILFLLNIPGVGLFQHPSHPDRIICDSGSDNYSYHGQGITIEMLEPMRRWKLKYNGLMRLMDVGADKKASRGDNKLVHVKFALIWRSYSVVTDFDTDISASCMANAFASEEWSQDFFGRVKKYHDRQTHYEQWGQLKGIIQVDGYKPREVLLRGLRDHLFSKRDWRHFHRYLICIIHLEDGTSINASFICMDVTLSRFTMGYIIHPNHVQEHITDIDLKLWEYGEDGVIPNEVKYNFTAGGKKYSVVCQIRIISEFYNGFEWEGKAVETLADYYVNGVPGRGIAEFCYRHSGDRRTMADCPKSDVKPLPDPKISQDVLNDSLIVNLEDDLCTKEVLTGGKGSQLAVLKKWSSDTDKFAVPDGFCITTSAYQKHVKENQDLDKTIQEMTNLSDFTDEQTKELCNRIHAVFLNSSVSESLRTIIGQEYRKLDSQKCRLVAVRSSAVGEDSSDLSAAGQLDTFLGISGVDEVIQAIEKCWACQYCYNAVQYRRQHGQPAISSMGVVVQLLAENTKISGVMFTQHPVTGNPAHVLINSNYGLGETVVSGSAEPDTMVVACSPNNNPQILSKEVGSKANKLAVNDSGTIEQFSVESKDSTELSLSEPQAFQLADLGRMIQSFAGGPRDIEWTISENGKINLVQARPITGDPTETEFELMHEFDSGYSNENYIMTTANIGEMMTGPVTPLTASTFARSIEYSMQTFYESGSPRGLCEYNNAFLGQTHDHLLINYLEMLRFHANAAFGFSKGSLDVNLFGRVTNVVSKDEYLSYHRNANTILRRLRNTVTFWKYLLGSRKEFRDLVDRLKDLHMDGQNSKDLYRGISEHMGHYAESWRHYMAYAAFSGISTTVLMMILSKGDPDWKTEHYSDVAMIYSSCEGVISASAPTLVKETAKHIYESEDKDNFINSSPEAAIEWLISTQGKAGETFRKLLQECGHRCLREAELHEKSWASDPVKLGQSLQAMVINFANEKPKDVTSVEEAIEKIKTPLTYLGRLILKWVVPQARKSIGGREWGKSNVIKISDLFKQAYWKLAGMMEKEGYLPDADLMFFLTHGEIGRLLRTRSARLVTRAMRRRRLYGRKRDLVFGEFIPKIPAKPLNLDRDVTFNDDELRIQGLPVSIGVIKAKARVINSLGEASEIQPGEVLIVHTTDIGWSPYFPLISGLVTDIGGLISHGAIVAREYGIPCIVGTKIGTTLLKSGDYVHLDGGRGFIQKLHLNEQAAKQNVSED